MSLVMIFGHWLNFHQMVFATLFPDHVELNLFDFGIAAGFIGIDYVGNGKVLVKYPLVAKEPSIPERKYHSSYIIDF